jgi:hypothetical protein
MTADTNLAHPTLSAMALEPKLEQPLPYTYARTRKTTPLFEQDSKRDKGIKKVGELRARSGLAVVGSWEAADQDGKSHKLGLLPNGLFVKAADLEMADASNFAGVDITKEVPLPVAFVVKRGVNYFEMDKVRAKKAAAIDYHSKVTLSGRYRTLDKLRYWATTDDRWVRHKDVTVVRRLHNYPDFATGQRKWIDVSVVTGTAVLYEGQRPVFTTLVSVGRDRLGDPKTSASTERGTFEVVAKHITLRGHDPKATSSHYELYDLPWVLNLSSGQMLHGAYWHDRFGIENTNGSLELSPADAARVFAWATPELPEGWHGVKGVTDDKTMIRVRK